MSRRDVYTILLRTYQNPTKLAIIFQLSLHGEMTVTQMSKLVGVGKPTLYHFVTQMVRDRLLTKPRAVVKRNYVEKFYRLDLKTFAAIDQTEQRRRMKDAKWEELKALLQSILASLGLHLRLFALEIENAGQDQVENIRKSILDNQVMLSYLILPKDQYGQALAELRKVNNQLTDRREENPSFKGNRLVILGLPDFRATSTPRS